MIKEITSLRMIFLLMIFMHHVALYRGGGILGVSFFFLLSGFVMTIGYFDRIVNNQNFNYVKYLLKKAINLYPLHWMCLAWWMLITGSGLNLDNITIFITNALLLHSWVPLPEFYFSFNQVSWFLSSLLFFIIIFPFVLKFFAQSNTIQLLLSIAILGFIYFLIITICPNEYLYVALYIHPLARCFDCIVGVILALFFNKFKDVYNFDGVSNFKKDCSYIGIFFILVAISLIINFRYCSAVFWLPICMLIYLISVESQQIKGNKSFITRVLSNKVIFNISSCYFAFYLTHMLMINTIKQYIWWGNFDSSIERNLFKLFTLCSTLIVSYILNLLFLKPIKSCSKRI